MLASVSRPTTHDTVEQARNAALEDAAFSGGRPYPCTVFQQGDRLMISASFPLSFIARQVKLESAPKGGNPRNSKNRPLIPDHVKTIKTYLFTNRSHYVLPPVTFNVSRLPQLHVVQGNHSVRSGFLIIHDDTYFYVTDGQHRIAAVAGYHNGKNRIPGVLDERPEMGSDALAVLIIVEPDIELIHQDFADAAQTKQIPPSLLAAFNMREPVNRVLARIVDNSRFLSGRVDETSRTLPKLSQSVFLLNQIRALVKELLYSDYAMSDEQLARIANQRIGTPALQNEFIAQASQLIDVLTDHMEPWRAIAQLPVRGGPANQIPDFRRDYLNMTATGLVIIGRVAFEINKLPSEAERIAKYRELAVKIDWKRSAQIWQGTVVTSSGNILTNRGPVGLAASRMREFLGL